MTDTKQVVEGTVTDVSEHDDHGKAEVTLTVECIDGETFTESYDCVFNQARSQNFSHAYGCSVENAKGLTVNVYTGNRYNPRHTLKKTPLVTVGGDVLVAEDADLPVPF